VRSIEKGVRTCRTRNMALALAKLGIGVQPFTILKLK
jgi:hypothetical protein